MQYVAKATLPWLRVRPHAVFALGGSMGGQETHVERLEPPTMRVQAETKVCAG